MARLIEFYVPRSFKPPQRPWLMGQEGGKLIEFQGAMKKSA
jgi:hypothetical protein